MFDSVQPHRRQPTRLPRPCDSPGKNTGVGCHFLLQCMKVKSISEVPQSCSTLSDPMDCSLPGSSVHGIFHGESTGVGVSETYSTLNVPSYVLWRGEKTLYLNFSVMYCLFLYINTWFKAWNFKVLRYTLVGV